MKSLILMLAAVFVVAAIGSAALSAATSSAPPAKPPQQALYGHVKSIAAKGHRFVMQFDPAWWLTGLAGEQACGCHPLSNDYYILDESHRVLTFAVRRDARVTVLTVHGQRPIAATSISVSELAQIVKGRNPRHRHLLEPKAGFWIRVGAKYPNPVVSLDQQYQP
jgi:hypothetical protein